MGAVSEVAVAGVTPSVAAVVVRWAGVVSGVAVQVAAVAAAVIDEVAVAARAEAVAEAVAEGSRNPRTLQVKRLNFDL